MGRILEPPVLKGRESICVEGGADQGVCLGLTAGTSSLATLPTALLCTGRLRTHHCLNSCWLQTQSCVIA